MVSRKKWDRKGQQLSRQQKSVHLVAVLFPNTIEHQKPRIPLCNLKINCCCMKFWLVVCTTCWVDRFDLYKLMGWRLQEAKHDSDEEDVGDFQIICIHCAAIVCGTQMVKVVHVKSARTFGSFLQKSYNRCSAVVKANNDLKIPA